MTDKEKILAKIESLLNETNYEPYTDETFGRIQSLKELKSYIDTLPEEPVSEDLTDVADAKFFELAKLNDKQDEYEIRKIHQNTFRHIALYFAQWQKEQMMKDSIEYSLSANDRGTIDEIIFALKSLGRERMISYTKEIEFLNRIRKL